MHGEDAVRRRPAPCNGPATPQDRWEEDAGLNAFTLGTCVAALVCGARFVDEPARGLALRLADDWNARIEDWTSVRATHMPIFTSCQM